MSFAKQSEPSLLETRNLTKRFGKFEALSDVSLKIQEGSVHAIVGENGAGKTTLLKHIFGLLQPTSGEVLFRGKNVEWSSPLDAIASGIGMVQQHFMLVEELPAIDNIILGVEPGVGGLVDRERAIQEMKALLPSPFLEVDWKAPVETLSVGDKQKIEILKLLYRRAKVLILDEPTAVLAPHEIEDFFSVLKRLRSEGSTVVVITHKLNEVFSLADMISVLRHGKLIGTVSTESTTPEKIVEMMIGRKPEKLPSLRSEISQGALLTCKQVKSKTLERGSLRDVNFELHPGEILGIAGVEGSGQGVLVETLLGLHEFDGDIEFEGVALGEQSATDLRHRMALVPEDRLAQGLWPAESCYHNLILGIEESFSNHGVIDESKVKSETKSWAHELDVRSASLDVSAGSLSGGNQQKLILARETRGRESKLMICHHPTRGVDIGAIEHIHREFYRLRNKGKSFLVLSSDLDELMELSDRILVLFNGATVKEFARGEFDALLIGKYMTGAAT